MKIIIFGASGVGTTTLANGLAKRLNAIHLDADEYYWEKTEPPFQIKLPLEKRNENLKADFNKHQKVIISGSLITWSDYWNTAFDIGIFLQLPPAIRMERLKNREQERYGHQLKTDQQLIKKSANFLAWAAKYDDASFEGRSISQHKKWIQLLSCEVLSITRDLTNEERIKMVLDFMLKMDKIKSDQF